MTLQSLTDYGKAFQHKVIGALLTDKKFLQEVSDTVKESYFNSSAHQWIVHETLKYYGEFHTTPTMEVLQVEYKKIDNDVLKVAVKEELRRSYESSQDDLDYVKGEFAAFCRNQEMKSAILESADLLKSGNYEGIRALIEHALKAGMEKNIGCDYKRDVESRYRDDYRPTIPLPWTPLNDVFAGGLGPGDLFLICGGPGIGKSWLAVAIAGEALKLGYNVNYYTLELTENYVARRIDSYLTGYSVEELKERRSEVDDLMNSLPGNLIIKEYPPKTATLTTIETHMQQCKDDGKEPNLVIIDYLDYVRPVRSGRYSERKEEVDDVYIGAKALAKSWDIPVVSPSQVNRTGAREDVVEGDRIAGSYDKNMVMDAGISLARKKEDKVTGTGRIHVMKNRFGPDGMTYNITMDTNNGHIEFEGLVEDTKQSTGTGNGKVPAFNLNKEAIAKFFES